MDTFSVSIRKKEEQPFEEMLLASYEIEATSYEIASKMGLNRFLDENPEMSIEEIDVDTAWGG
tara:strand:+ start:206 stop:394 length:189 start_codon:yes stop_codon:yes gene_type:complete